MTVSNNPPPPGSEGGVEDIELAKKEKLEIQRLKEQITQLFGAVFDRLNTLEEEFKEVGNRAGKDFFHELVVQEEEAFHTLDNDFLENPSVTSQDLLPFFERYQQNNQERLLRFDQEAKRLRREYALELENKRKERERVASSTNYYDVLGVASNASEDDIKKACDRLVAEYDPAQNPNDAEADALLKKVQEAYGVISDKKKREKYDLYGEITPPRPEVGESGFALTQDEIDFIVTLVKDRSDLGDPDRLKPLAIRNILQDVHGNYVAKEEKLFNKAKQKKAKIRGKKIPKDAQHDDYMGELFTEEKDRRGFAMVRRLLNVLGVKKDKMLKDKELEQNIQTYFTDRLVKERKEKEERFAQFEKVCAALLKELKGIDRKDFEGREKFFTKVQVEVDKYYQERSKKTENKLPNYYAVLGVNPDATQAQIDEALRLLTGPILEQYKQIPVPVDDEERRIYNDQYREEMEPLLVAHEMLSSPEWRAAYRIANNLEIPTSLNDQEYVRPQPLSDVDTVDKTLSLEDLERELLLKKGMVDEDRERQGLLNKFIYMWGSQDFLEQRGAPPSLGKIYQEKYSAEAERVKQEMEELEDAIEEEKHPDYKAFNTKRKELLAQLSQLPEEDKEGKAKILQEIRVESDAYYNDIPEKPATELPDYYAILKSFSFAKAEDFAKAYALQVEEIKKAWPTEKVDETQRQVNERERQKRMKALMQAYEALSSPKLRTEYHAAKNIETPSWLLDWKIGESVEDPTDIDQLKRALETRQLQLTLLNQLIEGAIPFAPDYVDQYVDHAPKGQAEQRKKEYLESARKDIIAEIKQLEKDIKEVEAKAKLEAERMAKLIKEDEPIRKVDLYADALEREMIELRRYIELLGQKPKTGKRDELMAYFELQLAFAQHEDVDRLRGTLVDKTPLEKDAKDQLAKEELQLTAIVEENIHRHEQKMKEFKGISDDIDVIGDGETVVDVIEDGTVELVKTNDGYELKPSEDFDKKRLKKIKRAIDGARENLKTNMENRVDPNTNRDNFLADVPENLKNPVKLLLIEDWRRLRSKKTKKSTV